jgi:PKD repeat protein
LDDSGTYYFTSSQISDIKRFLRNDRRLVVMGEHSGRFGVNTVNDLLNKVGVGIRQNSDNVLSSITPAASNITSDQITIGVNDLDMDGAGVSTLFLSGSAKSLVRDREDRDLVGVDNITTSPARPGGDVLVFGDTQVLDDLQLRNGDGDGPFDNFIFADNIVNFNGDNEPPVADAGLDQTVGEGYVVQLDGSNSSGGQSTGITPPPNVVSWWPGDGNANDITDNNHGTLLKGATFNYGKVGQAFKFDGIDDLVSIPDSDNLKLTKSFSIDAWIYVESFPAPSVEHGQIIFRGDNRLFKDPYYLCTQYNRYLRFHIESTSTLVNLEAPIQSGQWVFVAATLDDATDAMKIYLDGALAAQTTTKTRPFRNLYSSRNPGIGIGNHALATGQPFHGLIDELEVFERALTESEIKAIYNAGSTGKSKGTGSGSEIVSFEWDFESDGIYDYLETSASAPDGAFDGKTTHIYGDDGTYTATVRVTNDADLSDTDTCIITVINVAPAIDLITGPSGYEGALVTFTSIASDPGSDDLTFNWNWGDWTTDTVTSYYNNGINPEPIYDPITNEVKSPKGIYPFEVTDSPSHTFGDNGDYTITLTVEDDDGGINTDTMTIKINNVAPAILSINAPSGNEGSPITVTSSAIDRGSDDLTFTWDWGDGTSSTTNKYYNDGLGPDPYPSPLGAYPFSVTDTVSHTYGDDGVYTITLTVTDDDGGSTTNRASVMINNVAPTITLLIAPSGDEGSSLRFQASAEDVGSDDLTFSWDFKYGHTIDNIYYNNGIGPDPDLSPLGVHPFSASDLVTHSYGDNYNYTLTLTVTDDDDGIVTYSTTISIENVAPSIIELAIPYVAYEGTSYTYKATAIDLGSDDLTFEWEFGDSTPIIINTYYNDALGPDPYPSPGGTFPFTGQDILNHTYGDDYNYTLSLKVTDDDGGVTTLTTTIYVINVAPAIEPFGPFTIDENTPLDFTAVSTDLGSDDLTFIWNFDYGPTYTNIFYNDGVGPDPYPSPEGTYSFSATDHVTHTFGDNGVFLLTLTVKDDDRGATTYTTNITVENVAPVIEKIEAYMYANISLRVAGEKYHSVDIYLYEDDSEFWSGKVTRYPGSPDEQKATISNVKLNITKKYSAKVDYIPNDPRINGNVWGANPVWIIMTFEDGSESRLHHTFNVRKSYWNDDHWNHIDPWEVELSPLLEGHNLTLEAQATDIGSDDLTFTWTFGNVTTAGPTTYYNNGVTPDPYPSPEINPVTATDISKHSYTTSGIYTIILIVEDDDGGICVASLTI